MNDSQVKIIRKAMKIMGITLMVSSLLLIGFVTGFSINGLVRINAQGNIILNEYADCVANNQNNNSLIVPQYIYTNMSFYAYTCNLPLAVRNQTFFLLIAGSGHTVNMSISLLQDWHYINLPDLNKILQLQDNAMVTFQLVDSTGTVWSCAYSIAVNIVNVQSFIGL